MSFARMILAASPDGTLLWPFRSHHRCQARAATDHIAQFHGYFTRLSSFLQWLGIDLGDPAEAISLGIVRSGDKCAADLGGVPAGYDTEPKRLFWLDVTRREILH